MAGSIDSVKINTSLLMMREWSICDYLGLSQAIWDHMTPTGIYSLHLGPSKPLLTILDLLKPCQIMSHDLGPSTLSKSNLLMAFLFNFKLGFLGVYAHAIALIYLSPIYTIVARTVQIQVYLHSGKSNLLNAIPSLTFCSFTFM